ncbi:MAG: hypothetical protein ACE5JH_01680 [Acidobacteriota bacterium]
MTPRLRVGFPRMREEPGERRDFLPQFISLLQRRGAAAVLERGYGSGMGFDERDYLETAPGARLASREETFRQDYVLVLRCPRDEDIRSMRRGACLMSMLHFPTRP